jgi:hypothetical protein
MVAGRRKFATEIAAYETIPERLAPLAAPLIVFIEGTTGIALLSGVGVPIPSIVATLMFILFSAVVAFALHRGLTISCGCFGAHGKEINWFMVVRNIALALLALSSSWAPNSLGSGPKSIAVQGIRAYGIAFGIAVAATLIILLGRSITELFSIHKATRQAHQAAGLIRPR